MSQLMDAQMISCDKLNQLRLVRFLKDKAQTLELMKSWLRWPPSPPCRSLAG